MDPHEASGAIVGCECCFCRERRPTDNDRITYTAHDLATAYQRGYADAIARRLHITLPSVALTERLSGDTGA